MNTRRWVSWVLRQGCRSSGRCSRHRAFPAPPPPSLRPFTPALPQGQQEISEDVAEEEEEEEDEADQEAEDDEEDAEQERREFGIYQCLPVDDAEPDWESGEAATVEEYLRRVRWALPDGLRLQGGVAPPAPAVHPQLAALCLPLSWALGFSVLGCRPHC